MLWPKMKFAMVRACVTLKIVMPPRMPMVLDGVVTMMALALLILPPTRRNTPCEVVSASSPVLLLGSKTN